MHVAAAEAISSHMRASIVPVLSLSVSAIYCPAPVFFSRTDIDDTAKNAVTAFVIELRRVHHIEIFHAPSIPPPAAKRKKFWFSLSAHLYLAGVPHPFRALRGMGGSQRHWRKSPVLLKGTGLPVPEADPL